MCSDVVLGKNILLNCVSLRHKLSVLNYELGIRDLVIPLRKKIGRFTKYSIESRILGDFFLFKILGCIIISQNATLACLVST